LGFEGNGKDLIRLCESVGQSEDGGNGKVAWWGVQREICENEEKANIHFAVFANGLNLKL
jgi:hypothetical protein